MERPQHQERGEQTPGHTPRIYVVSLADYNNGVLHGDWLDADVEPDQLEGQIQALLARSKQADAEEWAIHGHEGFGGLDIDEHEDLETITQLAAGIDHYGDAFAAYADWVGTEHATLTDFVNHHAGSHETTAAFVREFAEDLGWENQVEQFAEDSGIGKYVAIDYELLAEDLRNEWYVAESSSGVHIFYP